MIVSDAKAAATRANAQRATGPRTPQGKANVRRNAHRHGLYAETAPDAGEDAAAFGQLLDDMRARFAPEGAAEAALVARLAAILWRLSRVSAAEHAVYATHEHDFVPSDDAGEAPVAVDLPDLWGHAHRAGNFDSAIARINRHEAHLQRMHQRTLDMLNTLQALRISFDPMTAAKTNAREAAKAGELHWGEGDDPEDEAEDDAPFTPDDPTRADLNAHADHLEDLAVAHTDGMTLVRDNDADPSPPDDTSS